MLVAAEPGRTFGGLNRWMGPADWPQAASLLHGTQQKGGTGMSGWMWMWTWWALRASAQRSGSRFRFPGFCTICLEEAHDRVQNLS